MSYCRLVEKAQADVSCDLRFSLIGPQQQTLGKLTKTALIFEISGAAKCGCKDIMWGKNSRFLPSDFAPVRPTPVEPFETSALGKMTRELENQ